MCPLLFPSKIQQKQMICRGNFRHALCPWQSDSPLLSKASSAFHGSLVKTHCRTSQGQDSQASLCHFVPRSDQIFPFPFSLCKMCWVLVYPSAFASSLPPIWSFKTQRKLYLPRETFPLGAHLLCSIYWFLCPIAKRKALYLVVIQ